jgi:hypothetical protein
MPPAEQSAEHHRLGRQPPAQPESQQQSEAISPHQRQGDRASGDDGDDTPRLPQFIRYKDLHGAGLVTNWQQVYNMIDRLGFPPGISLSQNIRVWRLDEVLAWLDARPSDRKQAPEALLRSKQTKGKAA